MSGAVAIARPGGLRRVWSWIRSNVLRLDPVEAARARRQVRAVTARAAAAEEASAPPLEPLGAKVRAAPAAPTAPTGGASVVPQVRKGLAEIPPLPHVVRELLRELADPASHARSVARIASTDPALAAALLRMVNSAAMGLRRKVTSVADAVSYLGYSTVRSLVVRLRLESVVPTRAGLRQAYDAEDLWVHSLAVAFAAEAIAERLPPATGVDRGFVSTLGLLHDIGKLAINSYFPESARQVVHPPAEYRDQSLLDRERRVLGGDHAEIGAMLATHWNLPPDLVEAIRWHHAPLAMPAALSPQVRAATGIVHLANQLAKYCYIYSDDIEIDIVPDGVFKQVGLPGPLGRMLNTRTRRAISRAIYVADESAPHTLASVRRFLQLKPKGEAPRTIPSIVPGEAHVEWVDEDWDPAAAIDSIRVDRRPAGSPAGTRGSARNGRARFLGKATDLGLQRMQAAALEHLDRIPADEHSRLPAKFVLRRLLPSLAQMAPGEPVEVCHSLEGEVLITTLRSPGLAFARRFGPDVSPIAARAALDRELANVLNLRWFSRICTSRDGAALLFHGTLQRG